MVHTLSPLQCWNGARRVFIETDAACTGGGGEEGSKEETIERGASS